MREISIHCPLLAHPDVCLFALIPQSYETLSLDLIDTFLRELFHEYRLEPSCLFLTTEGFRTMERLLIELPGFYRIYGEVLRHDDLARYANKATGRMLSVYPLPHLPPQTFAVGDLDVSISRR